MEDGNEASALRRLAEDKTAQTKTARLRGIIEEIEAAKAKGISNKQIVNLLNSNGFIISVPTFESLLHRIRKKQKEVNQTSARTSIRTMDHGEVRKSTSRNESGVVEEARLSTPSDIRAMRKKPINLDDLD